MRFFLLLLLLCALPLARAEGLPELGEPSEDVLSPQQERQIGEQSMFEIRADKSYLDDAEVNDYLNVLGGKLAAASNEPALDFEFFAINDHAINAFALPGGFVGVNSGLILVAQSESELASVLAHEVSHVTQHHLARMMAGQKYDTLASIAAAAAAIIAARNNPGAAGAIVAGPAAMLQRQLKFTREHEQEADRIGLATLQQAGFDVRAMPVFFERLERGTRLLDNNAPYWMRTHPVTSDRIADIANRVNQLPYRLVPDSLDFQLVRNKLLVMDKQPQEAVAYFADALGPRKFGNPVAQRYGLTLALLRAGDLPRARQELALLLKQPQAASNAMIQTVAGEIYRADRMDIAKLDEYYKGIVQAHPQHRALAYDYAEVLIGERRYEAALKLLGERVASYPNDWRLYELQARTYAALDKPAEEHHALAYAHLSQGDLHGGIDQLSLAYQSARDYYQLSVIGNELKHFREMAAAHSKKNSP